MQDKIIWAVCLFFVNKPSSSFLVCHEITDTKVIMEFLYPRKACKGFLVDLGIITHSCTHSSGAVGNWSLATIILWMIQNSFSSMNITGK